MVVNEELQDRRMPQRLRGRVTAYVNIGLCTIGAVFIVIGVLRSTLLLYVGCAFIGAAIGGFIRSRLPIHQMHMVPPHLHMVYRHELQRNIQAALQDGVQTILVMNSQRPMGVDQKTIEKNSMVTTYKPNLSTLHADSVDRISVISSVTESDEPSCIICLLSFKRGQEIRQLRCQHLFHVECIDKWLKINRLCPTCRVDLTGNVMQKIVTRLNNTSQALESTSVHQQNDQSANPPVVQEGSAVSIVFNALEDITRTEVDVAVEATEVTESSDPIPDVNVETDINNEHSALTENERTPEHSEHVCISVTMPNGQSEEPPPDTSCASYSTASRAQDEQQGSSSVTNLVAGISCARELRPTIITLSMPHNATPWV